MQPEGQHEQLLELAGAYSDPFELAALIEHHLGRRIDLPPGMAPHEMHALLMEELQLSGDMTRFLGALNNDLPDETQARKASKLSPAMTGDAHPESTGVLTIPPIRSKPAPPILPTLSDLSLLPKRDSGDAAPLVSAVPPGLDSLLKYHHPTMDFGRWRERFARLESRICQILLGERRLSSGILIGEDLVLTSASVIDVHSDNPHGKFTCLFDHTILPDGSTFPGISVELLPGNEILLGPEALRTSGNVRDPYGLAVLRLERGIGREMGRAPGYPARRGWEILPEAPPTFEATMPILLPVSSPKGSGQLLVGELVNPPSVQSSRYLEYSLPSAWTGKRRSGSPVLDMNCELLALHQGWLKHHGHGSPLHFVRRAICDAGYGRHLEPGSFARRGVMDPTHAQLEQLAKLLARSLSHADLEQLVVLSTTPASSSSEFNPFKAITVGNPEVDEVEQVLRQLDDRNLLARFLHAAVTKSPSSGYDILDKLIEWWPEIFRKHVQIVGPPPSDTNETSPDVDKARRVMETYYQDPGNPELISAYEEQGLMPEIVYSKRGAPAAPDRDIPSSDKNRKGSASGLHANVRERNFEVEAGTFYTRLGQAHSRVCRVDVDNVPKGTGFLIGGALVLTAHHAVRQAIEHGSTASISCLFDYKALRDDVIMEGLRIPLLRGQEVLLHSPCSPAENTSSPDAKLPTRKQLDFAVLRLVRPLGNERGWEHLPDVPPMLAAEDDVIILQHPAGGPMKLIIDHQSVIGYNSNKTRVRYRAKTERGSSGSPVFNVSWKLMALHHLGDPAYTARPDYNQGVAPLELIRRMIIENNYGHLLGWLPD